jgi:hypothetical protein
VSANLGSSRGSPRTFSLLCILKFISLWSFHYGTSQFHLTSLSLTTYMTRVLTSPLPDLHLWSYFPLLRSIGVSITDSFI